MIMVKNEHKFHSLARVMHLMYSLAMVMRYVCGSLQSYYYYMAMYFDDFNLYIMENNATWIG